MIVSLTGYTPAPRYDDVAFTSARVEYSTSVTGPWTVATEVPLTPDIDPSAPASHNFTVDVPENTYLRVVFTDPNSSEQPTDAEFFSYTLSVRYASVSDLRNYAPEFASRSDEDLGRALDAATKDVDDYAGFVPLLDTGRKFDPAADTTGAIMRATCAQAKYRLYMGPVFFTEQLQYRSVSGDIGTESPKRFGPEMVAELPTGFRVLTGRFT